MRFPRRLDFMLEKKIMLPKFYSRSSAKANSQNLQILEPGEAIGTSVPSQSSYRFRNLVSRDSFSKWNRFSP